MAKLDMTDTEIEKKLRQKIADGSQDPEDYRNLTDLLFPSGDYDEAIALYQRALTFPLTAFEKAQLSMELGWIYYDIGQQLQVAGLAQDALSLLSAEPRNAEVLYCLGASQALLAFSLSSTDANAATEAAGLALHWLEQAIADDPDFKDKPYAYIDAARMHSMLGNVDKAIAHCERCLDREINENQRILCLIVYSQTLQREEHFAKAEQAIAEAFRYGKNYKSGLVHGLYIELGGIQRSTNRLAESKRSFEQALSALKSDPYFYNSVEILGEVQFNLASVCYELGEYEDAISAYNEVLRCDTKDGPSYWTALYWLGCSYEAREDHRKARDCYAEVSASSHATDTDRTLARESLTWSLAKLRYQSREYREAAAAFEELVTQYSSEDTKYWNALLWLGSCHQGLEEHAKAKGCFEKVHASSRASEVDKAAAEKCLTCTLAKLHYESGQYSQAAAKFKEVLGYYSETDPDHWNTMIWLGCCYQGLAAYTREQGCYQEVLASRHATEHDKVLARRRLASTLGKAYHESRSYPEAIAAFEEVLASCGDDHPDRFHALVCLGYAYLGTKSYTKAREFFEEVVASAHAPEAEKHAARKALAGLRHSKYQ
jgi:tetratricopeptide (TPR) repeat protein